MNNQKCAIVTGAGSGVGQATAILLAQAHYNLLLVGRTASKLQDTAHQAALEVQGSSNIHTLAGDLTNSDFCLQVVEEAVVRMGRIDAIANVAGHAQVCPIENITADEWRKTVDTNLSCVMYLTAAAWPVFRQQKGGVIVNISSMASIDPFPGFAMYAPTKAALNMFTHITAQEGAKLGIKAVSLAPGAIETPMLRSFFDEKTLPRDKTLSPRQVGQVIVDCITGTRPFSPGQVIELPSP